MNHTERDREPRQRPATTIRFATMRLTLGLQVYYAAAFAAGGFYLPYFPRWLEARGVCGLRLGVISAAAPAMAIVAPPAFGLVADTLGLRAGLLQIATAGAFLAFAGLAMTLAFGVKLGFGGLLIAALLIALFRSPMGVMADVVAIETALTAGTTYGRLRLWGSLGFLAAAVAGGWAVDPRSVLGFPLVATACLAAAFLASLTLPRRPTLPWRRFRDGSSPPSQSLAKSDTAARSRKKSPALQHILTHDDFSLFLVAIFLGQCGHAAYDMCFSLRLFDLGIPRSVIGISWGIGTGAEVLLMAWSSRLFHSFSALSILAFALACAAVRWVLLAVVRSSALLLFFQPLHAISFGLMWIAAVTYTSRQFPTAFLASAQGLFTTAMGAGSVIGMLIWSPIYLRSGGTFVFAGAACFAVCASALAVMLDRKARARTQRRRAPGNDGTTLSDDRFDINTGCARERAEDCP